MNDLVGRQPFNGAKHEIPILRAVSLAPKRSDLPDEGRAHGDQMAEIVESAQQIVIVGFDGQPEGRQAIKEGKILADPIQFPDRMGVQIVGAIVAHSKGETVPPQMLIPTSLSRQPDAAKDADLK